MQALAAVLGRPSGTGPLDEDGQGPADLEAAAARLAARLAAQAPAAQAPAAALNWPSGTGPSEDGQDPADLEGAAAARAPNASGPAAAPAAASADGPAARAAAALSEAAPADWADPAAVPTAAGRARAAAAEVFLVQWLRAVNGPVTGVVALNHATLAVINIAIWGWVLSGFSTGVVRVSALVLLTLTSVRLAVAAVGALTWRQRSSCECLALYFGRAALVMLTGLSLSVWMVLAFSVLDTAWLQRSQHGKGIEPQGEESSPRAAASYVTLCLVWEFCSLTRLLYISLIDADDSPPQPPPLLAAKRPFGSIGERERALCPQCAICLSTFEDDDSVVVLACSHTFHHSCMLEWRTSSARTSNKCGSCPYRCDASVPSKAMDERPLDLEGS